ncbi:lytic transglycosylase domain-containing protein [Rhodospirillaceae bacterium SYSU D60014]|uniref:lytic transglycosylase domain-containing protein n=1 Tax=Virgifigura deserti TaxID=2268457 RepID=UPI0013C42E4D
MPKLVAFLLALAVLVAPLTATAARADSGALAPSDMKIYRAAFEAVEAERWEEARQIAAYAENRLPAKVIRWLDLTRPDPRHSFDELSAFLDANPNWPLRATIQMKAERAMPDDLPPDEVARWFRDRPQLTASGSIQKAHAMIALGLETQAALMLRRDWVRFDMSASEERKFLALSERYLKPKDHVARLDRLLWDRERAAAKRMMKRVDSGHRALAEARLLLMSMRSGVDAAIDRVPASLVNDPGLVYERARWRRRMGRASSVIELLNAPLDLKNLPRPERLWNESENAARLALARGEISVAYSLAQNHGATEGIAFAEAEWLAGWIALRFLSEPQVAYKHFKRLYTGVGSSVSRARGAYWTGRAVEEMGNVALARSWYRKAAENLTAYYGQLAAQRLGPDFTMRFTPPRKPTDRQLARFADRELVQVVRLLGQLDQADHTRPFLVHLTDLARTPTDHRMVAHLATELGRDDLLVTVAKAARMEEVEMVEYLYPLRLLPEHTGPEDALILAVMRQESVFAVDAVSHAGARGLMQLMPATARHVARKLKLPYDRKQLTRDPILNIKLGSAYLSQMVERFSGSYLLAIAAYNAGPSRVVEWMRVYGDPREPGIDAIDWIESIPFSETRNYVQRVLENLQVYRHRLGQPMLAFSFQEDLSRQAEY